MDSSFELLSTMSPVITKNKLGTHKNDPPTKLALNRRRSICFDRVIKRLHEDTVILVEDSGDEFGDTSNIVECKDSNNSVIVIDSNGERDEEDETAEKVTERDTRSNILAAATSDDDSSGGDTKKSPMETPVKGEISDSESDRDVQTDGFGQIEKWIADVNEARINNDKSILATPQGHCGVNHKNYSDEDENTPISPGAENILDQLYGDSWRRNKDALFSKSEQRRQPKREGMDAIFKTQTERAAHHILKVDKNDLNKKNLFRNFDGSDADGIFKEKTKNTPKTRKPTASNFDLPQISDPYTSSSDCEPSRNTPGIKKSHPSRNRFWKTPKTEPCRRQKSSAPIPESPMYRIQQICDPDTSSDESITEGVKKHLNICHESDSENDKNGSNRETKRNVCTNDLKRGLLKQNITSPDNLFLISLSADLKSLKTYDVVALMYRNNYKEKKQELTQKLFEIYNRNIFDDAIDGDTPLEWNKNLRKTAGLCACRSITHRDGTRERKVRIVLSVKVLDSADRLRDTLLHEMCHAATWIIDKVNGGHGPLWRAWANRAKIKFPELPEVSVRHDYKINSKYVYKCTNCGYCIYRHSKSLNTETKRCGYCYGTFEVLLNKVSKRGSIHPVAVTPRKNLNGFAKYVQENYARYRSPCRTHGDVMRLLSEKFAEKVSKD